MVSILYVLDDRDEGLIAENHTEVTNDSITFMH